MAKEKIVTDERLLALLIEHGSVTRVAKIAGLSRNAIYMRLRQNEDFRTKYEEAKNAVLQDACGAISTKLETAAAVLYDVATNDRAAVTVRVSAADSLLRHGLRYIEQGEILKRLDALEQAMNESGGGRRDTP